jgi:hypothetical protein
MLSRYIYCVTSKFQEEICRFPRRKLLSTSEKSVFLDHALDYDIKIHGICDYQGVSVKVLPSVL